MNEEERAKQLSEAIDALLQGGEPELGLDDPDFIELLRIARLRHQAGEALADVGLAYQELLRRILQARLAARSMELNREEPEEPLEEENGLATEDPREFLEPLDPDQGKLINFLHYQARHSQSRPAGPAAMPIEAARSEPSPACQRQPRTRTVIPSWARRGSDSATKAADLSAGLDRLLSSRRRSISVEDPELAELMEVAQLRRHVGRSLAAVGSPYKRRLWAALQLRLAASLRRQSYAAQRPAFAAAVGHWSWQRAAAAAAAVAVLLAALGPLPATGFADHPVTQVFDFLAHRAGVEEVEGPPPTEVPAEASREMISPEEARDRLGLPVKEPSYLPESFKLASSLYYPQGMTSPEQGMLVLTYTQDGVDPRLVDAGPQIIIYQERTSPNTIAQKTAYVEDVTIADSLPATYVRGMWSSTPNGTLEWVEGDTEVLVFDSEEIRTFIFFRNSQEEKEELLRIAESMLTQ